MSFAGMLDTTCNIIRLVGTDDGQGGQTTTDVVLYRRVPCRFESLSGSKAQATYAKLQPLPDFLVYMEHQSGIKEGDRVVDSRSREYGIRLIEDWSIAEKYMKLAVVELKRGE